MLLADGDGVAPCAVWLTQRLLNELVSALATQLTAMSPEADVERQAVRHRWSQSMASFTEAPSTPSEVARAVTAAPHLVSTVRIRRSRALLQLRFARAETSELVVTFTEPELRRWLLALHRLATRAGWSQTRWPAWIKAPAPQAPERLN